jgi:hypothetical protein
MGRFTDGRHLGAAVEEWVFAAWALDASLGVVSGHRIVGRNAWYWAALARAGRPLLHVIDDHIPVRADPFIVKGEALWAEHTRDAPMEQWSVCNETFASALADPDEALGNAYGDPTPIAFDLEWYATAEPVAFAPSLDGSIEGYEQAGVVQARSRSSANRPSSSMRSPGTAGIGGRQRSSPPMTMQPGAPTR